MKLSKVFFNYLLLLYFFLAITEVGHLNSAIDLDCGMAMENTSNKPLLKIFNCNGETIEEEDFTKKEISKKFLVLRNKKTNKVFTIYIYYFLHNIFFNFCL